MHLSYGRRTACAVHFRIRRATCSFYFRLHLETKSYLVSIFEVTKYLITFSEYLVQACAQHSRS